MKKRKLFSDELEAWLSSDDTKTLGSLHHVFGEKSFAVAFLILLFIPALPVPTGGLSHVTEAIAIVLAAQMAVGRRALWIPKGLKHRSIGKTTQEKALPFMMRRIRWLENYSKPRLGGSLDSWPARSTLGIIILLFCIMAFISIPFSGLDTLPSLGVVVIALGIILEDVVLIIAGTILGCIGTGIIIASGAALSAAIQHLLH